MTIEEKIFNKSKPNYSKLIKYGFKQKNDSYIYKTNFLNNEFMAEVTINENSVNGKVYDLNTMFEYTNIRLDIEGSFVNSVKEEYIKILKNIKDNCFESEYFNFEQSNRITSYIINKYNAKPEFLWDKYPGYGVFKNKDNKWFGIIMDIDKSKISNKTGLIEVINLKVDKKEIDNIIKDNGIYEAYHMNKKSWVSVSLDDTLDDEFIIDLIDNSYSLVNNKVD